MSKVKTIAIAIALTCISRAAEQPGKPPAQEPTGWWLKSSLSENPLPAKTLFHFQGTLSYMNADGNTNGTMFDAKGELTIRHWRFTSRILTEHANRDMSYGSGGAVKTTETMLRDHMTLDVYKRFSLVGGIEDYKNTMMFMDHRMTVYGGFGAHVLQLEKHQVHFVAAVGHSNFQFEEAALMRINPTAISSLRTTSPNSNGLMLMQNWNWKINPKVTFRQDGSYMDMTDGELGNRWSTGFDFNFAVARKFSLALGYQAKHEDNAFIRALRVKPYDRSFTTGIRFTL